MILSPGTTIALFDFDRTAIARHDWSSSESMLRVGGPYRCGIMIEHNWRPISRSGSCIFLHVWDSVLRGTAGCTAVSSAHLEQLLHSMDAQNNPLIISPGTGGGKY